MMRFDNKTSDNVNQFREVVKQFTDLACQVHGSHSYAAGYLEAMVGQMLRHMCHKDQQYWIEAMQRSADVKRCDLQDLQSQNRSFERV